MKKMIFYLLCFCAASYAHGQITFGPEVGGQYTNYPGKTGGTDDNAKGRLGFRVGGIADIPLSQHFSFQPGLLYVLNGYKLDYVVTSFKGKMSTLEVPLNIMFKAGKPGGERFFLGVGPYVAFNLAGSVERNYYGDIETHNFKIGNDAVNDDFKRVDMGLGLNIGYQLTSGLFIRGHFQRGVVNQMPGGDSNNSTFSTNSGISVGYLFGGKVVSRKS